MLTCNLQRQDLFYSRQDVILGSLETRSILLQVGCYIGFSRDKIYFTTGRMLYWVLQRQDLFYSRQDVIQGSLETRSIQLQAVYYVGLSRDNIYSAPCRLLYRVLYKYGLFYSRNSIILQFIICIFFYEFETNFFHRTLSY